MEERFVVLGSLRVVAETVGQRCRVTTSELEAQLAQIEEEVVVEELLGEQGGIEKGKGRVRAWLKVVDERKKRHPFLFGTLPNWLPGTALVIVVMSTPGTGAKEGKDCHSETLLGRGKHDPRTTLI
jgi:hypothetical protein